MIAFIDAHRDVSGVEPICRVLPIAPASYYAHVARRRDPARLPARARRDEVLRAEIRRVWDGNFRVYGVRKVWRQLGREGIAVARCTTARLMQQMGLSGAVRGKAVKTTISNPAVPCPRDKVHRQFQAPRPNALWVADFTYVATWQGFVYVAFVIDTFALLSLSKGHCWLAGLTIGRDQLCPRCPGTGALPAAPLPPGRPGAP
jgi:putative transposase